MKLIGRIGMILLVALAVAGATVALVNNGALDSLGIGNGDGGRPAMGEFDGERPAMGDFDGESGGRGERGSGLGSVLSGLGRNLGKILVIVAGVVVGQWLWSLVSRRHKADPGGAGAAEKTPEQEFV